MSENVISRLRSCKKTASEMMLVYPSDMLEVLAAATARAEAAEADAERLAGELHDLSRQLENGLGRKLGSSGPPGHIDYISKKDAAEWCRWLATEARAALAAHEAAKEREGDE